jgi:hypothetical protein
MRGRIAAGLALVLVVATSCLSDMVHLAGESPIVEECRPGIQDCEQPLKCTPFARTDGDCCVDATHCVAPVESAAARLGEPCTRTRENDDCELGLFCMTESSGQTGAGVCMKMCDPRYPTTCPDGICIPYDDGFLPLCQSLCDPLAPVCGDGFGCYLALAFDEFVCAREGAGEEGDACVTVAGCKPGLLCLDGAGQAQCDHGSCCARVCEMGGDGSECGAGLTCQSPWPGDKGPDKHLSVGACM